MRLTNSQKKPVSLVVEPWGEIYPLAVGATVEVRFEINGDAPVNLPEIVWSEGIIKIYAGENGDIELYSYGHNLREVKVATNINSELLVA